MKSRLQRSSPDAKRAAEKSAGRGRALYVLSDSTGNLARHMIAAFLTQFPSGALDVRIAPFIRNESRLAETLEKARAENAGVCHAIVSRQLKDHITHYCHRHALPCRDLTGGIVEFLSEVAAMPAMTDIEALHRIDESYKARIGAMEFTLAHDDGLGTETLHEADVVLAGVSRTSKTPTSIYLAQQGYRAANVALAMAVTPPAKLLAMPPRKVIGLLINPKQLAVIRMRRDAAWNNQAGDYSHTDHVTREITWARRLFAEHGWSTLDVTDQAIEETAARIIELIGLPRTDSRADHFKELG